MSELGNSCLTADDDVVLQDGTEAQFVEACRISV